MRVSLVDTEVKKSATLSMRLIPQHKDEIVMAAHEEGTNVSDLLVKAFFYYWKDKAKTEEKRKIAEEMYKGMERATRRARPVIRAALESSTEMSLLDYINKIEKRRPSPSTARTLYEKLLSQVKGTELIELVKSEFRDRFNIPEPLVNRNSLVVYPDLIKIDTCGCYPIIHRLVDTTKLDERCTLIFRNFPSVYYPEAADFQRKIWNLCRKEKTI
ncbi:MAG: hypothetical protein DRP01_01370 [Archaeoglobales archaeon]|nr:MAG: hypothetical protein DRP01_01370 [Archaeoglobales archaeon]